MVRLVSLVNKKRRKKTEMTCEEEKNNKWKWMKKLNV